MIQLICISENCNSRRLVSNLNEVLPHLKDSHELMEIQEFEEQFYKVQRDIRNFSTINDLLHDSICAIQKQIAKIDLVFKDKLNQIQALSSNIEIIEMNTKSVDEATQLFNKFKDIKINKKELEINLTEGLECFLDDFMSLFTKEQNNLLQIDELVKQIKLLQVTAPFNAFKQSSNLTNLFQLGQQFNQEIQNQPNSQSNLELGQMPLKGYKDQRTHSIHSYILEVPSIIQQQQQNQHLLVLSNINTQLLGKERENIPNYSIQQETQSKLIQQQEPTLQLNSETEKSTQMNKQNTQPRIEQKIVNASIKQPAIAYAALIKQIRFDSMLSEKNLRLKNNNTEAIVENSKYMICDKSFRITEYSKLDVVVRPNHPQIQVKIGIVSLNRWNQQSIAKYTRTQETQSNNGNPCLYLENFKINKEQQFNLKIYNEQLEYTHHNKVKDLIALKFQPKDDITFFIELKQCRVIIQ